MSARRHVAPPRGAPNSSDRKAMLAKVHIAKKELRLTEDSYRDLLSRVTGSESASKLSVGQLDAVLAEMRRAGWKPPTKAPHKPQIAMIQALWRELADFVADSSDEALRAFVRRQTKSPLHPNGVSAPQFLDAEQANKVLEGLKAWLRRERAKAANGRFTPPPAAA